MTTEREPAKVRLSEGLGFGGGSRDYRRMLEEGFSTWREVNPEGTPESRVAYLGDYIFGFTTYDDALAEEFAVKALEVCRAISERKTFEYVADPANYRWFVLMCNMPFFARRLNWGTSIRGAWWDTSPPNDTELDTSGLLLDGKQLTKPMTFATEQWNEFIAAVLAFGINDQALTATAKSTKGAVAIPGVRIYDAGGLSVQRT